MPSYFLDEASTLKRVTTMPNKRLKTAALLTEQPVDTSVPIPDQKTGNKRQASFMQQMREMDRGAVIYTGKQIDARCPLDLLQAQVAQVANKYREAVRTSIRRMYEEAPKRSFHMTALDARSISGSGDSLCHVVIAVTRVD